VKFDTEDFMKISGGTQNMVTIGLALYMTRAGFIATSVMTSR
jgi:ABC-type branched-subunit amino acid transport system ATPase component